MLTRKNRSCGMQRCLFNEEGMVDSAKARWCSAAWKQCKDCPYKVARSGGREKQEGVSMKRSCANHRCLFCDRSDSICEAVPKQWKHCEEKEKPEPPPAQADPAKWAEDGEVGRVEYPVIVSRRGEVFITDGAWGPVRLGAGILGRTCIGFRFGREQYSTPIRWRGHVPIVAEAAVFQRLKGAK